MTDFPLTAPEIGKFSELVNRLDASSDSVDKFIESDIEASRENGESLFDAADRYFDFVEKIVSNLAYLLETANYLLPLENKAVNFINQTPTRRAAWKINHP